jgi:hypothetical protein
MNRKLTFTLTEQMNPLRTRTIADLCDYLTDRLLVPSLRPAARIGGANT